MRTLAFITLICLTTSVADAAVIHQYQLNGTLADDFGGPNLVATGGTLNATNYAFGPNQGLSLSNALPNAGNYSIELIFQLATTTGYRKLIDFNDLSVDSGVYNLNTSFIFYSNASGTPAGAFSPNVDVRVVLTRDDASDQVVGYVNGVSTFTFTDSSNVAVFTAANNIIHFFKDDFQTSQGEASAGIVDFIRIFDGSLTSSEVAALDGPSPVPTGAVPEPASLALWGLGALGCSVGAYRRKRAA